MRLKYLTGYGNKTTGRDDFLKYKLEEENSPFDDIFFWLHLVSMDFTFGFEEITNTESDKLGSETIHPQNN
jgi:hypothetical protein